MADKEKKKLAVRRDITSLIQWKSTPLTPAIFQRAVQDHMLQEQRGTYVEFYERYAHVRPDADIQQFLVLRSATTDIVAMHRDDSLEQIRKSQGLDEYREKLTQDIYDNIDFDRGVAKVLAFLNRRKKALLREHKIKRAESLEHIAAVMPEITASEIAWISTLKNVPEVYFFKEYGVPTITEFNMDGIEFGFDGLNAFDLQREHTFDPLVRAGFTGLTRETDFCAYAHPYNKAFRQLAALILSDSFIYQRLYNENRSNALINGDGRFKRALISQDLAKYSLRPEDFDTKRIHELGIPVLELRKLDEEIRQRLSSKVMHDIGRDEKLKPLELLTVVGLLAKVPDAVFSPEPFTGFILPYGKGVKVLDHKGTEVEYVPYEDYIQIMAQEKIHYSVSDISRKNLLISTVFDQYAQGIEARFSCPEVFEIDRLREEFRQRFGIIISPRSTKTLSKNRDYFKVSFGKDTGTDDTHIDYSLKMGIVELEAVLHAVAALPEGVRPEISTIIRKYTSSDAADMILGGVEDLGHYYPHTKAVELLTPEDRPFHVLSAIEKQAFFDTCVHELGHGTHENLTPDQKEEWKAVSQASFDTPMTDDYRRSFVFNIEVLRRLYSLEDFDLPQETLDKVGPPLDELLIGEDFTETFAAYVNHAVEFRRLAEESPALAKKYEYMRKLFEGQSGSPCEYDTDPYISLKDLGLHKSILFKKKLNIMEALKKNEEKFKSEEAASLEIREEVVPSLEALEGNGMDPETAEHIYERENAEHTFLLREVYSFIPDADDVQSVDPLELMLAITKSPAEAAQYLRSVIPGGESLDLDQFTMDMHASLEGHRYRNTHSILKDRKEDLI